MVINRFLVLVLHTHIACFSVFSQAMVAANSSSAVETPFDNTSIGVEIVYHAWVVLLIALSLVQLHRDRLRALASPVQTAATQHRRSHIRPSRIREASRLKDERPANTASVQLAVSKRTDRSAASGDSEGG